MLHWRLLSDRQVLVTVMRKIARGSFSMENSVVSQEKGLAR